MKKLHVLLPVFLLMAGLLSAQSWRIHLGGNELYPIGNELLGYHPIIGYSKDDGRGLLIGGFGAGLSYTLPLQEAYEIKFQTNLHRSRFYDQPTILNDENGQALVGIIGVNTNWNGALLMIPQYYFADWLKVGAGLGGRYLFRSMTDYGQFVVNGEAGALRVKNRSLAPFTLLAPLEVTGTAGRFSLTTRAELGLTRASHLDAYRKQRNLVLFVELGYRLNQ